MTSGLHSVAAYHLGRHHGNKDNLMGGADAVNPILLGLNLIGPGGKDEGLFGLETFVQCVVAEALTLGMTPMELVNVDQW